ncbi:hypothetical protein LTR10_023729 [Elasticomyces elasticus]|uniref:Uncharacterized protein n=1 Tax=Exophiala sideris TaxID=1016849 RepID=A0ABR0J025_9EURO|nr:hypothetical protein LTR10_023729 [Elasticomyces elasticus]KAK5023583.1 hypothetical protein LTS07_009091 [Exophiala sideris]KAK5029583.1 hypothetical protein LTR13_008503 [Exophiala sideris]KAK5053372.1 hypothetical protein LTR69_009330 [Exophiala sideris]KAK5179130.1 hypothetical protein LTR44_008284 [Eurotiomycetes sp. CCFEE 6388]
MASFARQGDQQQQAHDNESASTIPPSDLAELIAFIDPTLEHQSPSDIAALITDIDPAFGQQSPVVSEDQYVPDVAAYFQSTMTGPMRAPASGYVARKRNAAVAFDDDEYKDENDYMDEDNDDNGDNGDETGLPKHKATRKLRMAKDDVMRIKPPSKHSKGRGAVYNRERREEEDDDRKKLCEKIDDDILKQVDAAGGSTPAGRVFKSALLMIERLQGQGV